MHKYKYIYIYILILILRGWKDVHAWAASTYVMHMYAYTYCHVILCACSYMNKHTYIYIFLAKCGKHVYKLFSARQERKSKILLIPFTKAYSSVFANVVPFWLFHSKDPWCIPSLSKDRRVDHFDLSTVSNPVVVVWHELGHLRMGDVDASGDCVDSLDVPGMESKYFSDFKIPGLEPCNVIFGSSGFKKKLRQLRSHLSLKQLVHNMSIRIKQT